MVPATPPCRRPVAKSTTRKKNLSGEIMRRRVLLMAASLGIASNVASGYAVSGHVTFAFGGSSGANPQADVSWIAAGFGNSLASMSNGTWFTTLDGYNLTSHYNADFATAEYCAPLLAGMTFASTRKYGCRGMSEESGEASFFPLLVADEGPRASASGVIRVSDTMLTGTLTIDPTTDEPTGATTTMSGGVRVSNSVGNGLDGYNYRAFDTSPFGNAWYGITTAGTLELHLTGIFGATAWTITGGSVRFTDAGFACQHGGWGGAPPGTLCIPSLTAGGHQADGAHLSWGMDLDGAGPNTWISQIPVRNGSGSQAVADLSGVLASLAVDINGNITTLQGEFRRGRGVGPSTEGCPAYIRYDGNAITCGTLTAGLLAISGTVTPVPAPPVMPLLAASFGMLMVRALRRRPTAGAVAD
jgi:hypothetical protein